MLGCITLRRTMLSLFSTPAALACVAPLPAFDGIGDGVQLAWGAVKSVAENES